MKVAKAVSGDKFVNSQMLRPVLDLTCGSVSVPHVKTWERREGDGQELQRLPDWNLCFPSHSMRRCIPGLFFFLSAVCVCGRM